MHLQTTRPPDEVGADSDESDEGQVAAEHPVLLVVDDDAGLRESLADVLRDERYVVATATDGRDAMSLLKNGLRPDLVVLDVWMPNIDGVTALHAMRDDPLLNDIPVILITAIPEEVDAGARAHASAFLRKPLNLNTLVETIERHRKRKPGEWPG